MGTVENRIHELGLELPACPSPVADYAPAVQFQGNLVYVSGQGCAKGGKLLHQGKLGSSVTIEEGAACAEQAVLNCLAALKSEIKDLDRVDRVVKLLGFVASEPGFDQQPYVINGASRLLIQLFGENGKHARAAIGTNELPFGTPVEIEMIVELKPSMDHMAS